MASEIKIIIIPNCNRDRCVVVGDGAGGDDYDNSTRYQGRRMDPSFLPSQSLIPAFEFMRTQRN